MATLISDDPEHYLQVLFSSTARPDSPNLLSIDIFKESLLEYLEDYDQELAEFPAAACDAHWTLVMDDGDLEHDAMFAIMLFHVDAMEVIAGTGDSSDIQTFAETEFPEDTSQLLPTVQSRFRVPMQSIRIQRSTTELWLGRKFA